jgi:hypothetical protein
LRTPDSGAVPNVDSAHVTEHFDWSALASSKTTETSADVPPGPKSVSDGGLVTESNPLGPQNLAAVAASTPAPTPDVAPDADGARPVAATPPSSEPIATAVSFQMPTREESRPSLHNGDIPRLRLADIGAPREPGQYRSRYGIVEVTREDLMVWQAFPGAVFTVVQPSPYSDQMVSRLGTFQIEHSSLSTMGPR